MDPAKQKTRKSMNKSVPSIAVRFHCGDEDLDIYPSADDEDDEAKDEDAPSALSEAPATSRDPSPIKEYFKGLGKRSTSVDSSMDAPGGGASTAGGGASTTGGGASDTWRMFHELRGKITKTVEEKLTEMKAERKTGAAASPQHSAAIAPPRMRGGADDVSQTESEDSESLPVEEDAAAKKKRKKLAKQSSSRGSQASRERHSSRERRASRDSRGSRGSDDLKFKPSKETKESKMDKKRSKEAKMRLSEVSTTDEDDLVETAFEALEGPRFELPEDLDDTADTVDFRTTPPTTYFREKRKSHVYVPPPEPRLTRWLRWLWRARWMMAFLVALAAYIMCPLSTFANGILTGVMLTLGTHFTVGLSGWLEPEEVVQREPFLLPNFASFPPLDTPIDNEDARLSAAKCAGWMNELPYDYDPETYHINHTQTVYVRLSGSTLIISHPKNKVQKRATWDERNYKLKFVHQRIYDLNGCELRLMPEGLTRRRIWSKKYPLCLVLPKGASAYVSNPELPTKARETDFVPRPAESDFQEETASQLARENVDSVSGLRTPTFGGSRTATGSASVPQSPDVSQSSAVPHFSPSQSPAISRSVAFHPHVAAVPIIAPVEQTEDVDVNYDPGVTDSSTATCLGSATDLGGQHITFAEEDFVMVDEQAEMCLYLFARADRQKEDWYRRLQIGIRYAGGVVPEERPWSPETSPTGSISSMTSTATTATTGPVYVDRGPYRVMSPVVCPANEFSYELGRPGSDELVFGAASDIAARHYLQFMARFPVQIPRMGSRKGAENLERVEKEVDCDVLWFNAMLGHILYDLMASPDIIEKVMHKIQKKLDIIKLPFFIENLKLSDLDLGRDVPLIHRASRPVLDEHGLWVDLDISFEGCITLTIETKLNLMKLKKNRKDDEEEADDVPSPPNSPAAEQEADVEGAEGNEQDAELEESKSGLAPRVDSSKMGSHLFSSKSMETETPEKEEQGPEARAGLSKSFGRLGTNKFGSRLLASKLAVNKSASVTSQPPTSTPQLTSAQQLSAIYNSDVEDSAETSETETDTKSAPTSSGGESEPTRPVPRVLKTPASPARPGPPGSKGMAHLMNRFVASNFFQQATENKYIKRAMEGVSNTVITLTVEVRAISGQLAVNLPPPPSDRIWYGFRGSPNIWIKARPKFGERSVSMHRIVTFIEKKIVQEMEKKIVLPNMDDIVIPPMTTQLP